MSVRSNKSKLKTPFVTCSGERVVMAMVRRLWQSRPEWLLACPRILGSIPVFFNLTSCVIVINYGVSKKSSCKLIIAKLSPIPSLAGLS